MLGLKLRKADDGQLKFERANTIPEVSQGLTRKKLFSICGKLVGHYPKAGWLRVACSYVKRHAEGDSWDDYVGDGIRDRMKEIVEEVRKNDPVKGVWWVPKSDSGTKWCDASNLAMGVVLEIGGTEVEDASWMRKKEYNHINVAELEAVLKGINLCAKWNLKNVMLVTDSATVFGWIKLTLTEEKKVKTKGAAEILVKRRLGILKTLIQELGLTLTVKLVKSEENKADALTRVRKRWLVPEMGMGCAALEEVKKMHNEHHMGVERTWYLAKRLDKSAEKETVKAVVRQCQQCQSIDPAPASHTPGELGVQEAWSRLAIDVTHYAGRPYLSMVDCGPGRFVVWRELKGETATEICHELDKLFYERGPVDELLMDNALAFRSQDMLQLMEKWGVRPFYRAAYRAGGNGIIERSHRTIKTMAERSGKSPIAWVGVKNFGFTEKQKKISSTGPGATQALVGSRGKALGRGLVGLSPPSSHSFLHLFFFSSASISRALVVSLSWTEPGIAHGKKKRTFLGGPGGMLPRKFLKVETKICAIWGILEANLKKSSTLMFMMNITFDQFCTFNLHSQIHHLYFNRKKSQHISWQQLIKTFFSDAPPINQDKKVSKDNFSIIYLLF